MEEKEFMEFLNTIANNVSNHFEDGKRNDFSRYYIIDGFHFCVIMEYDFFKNVYNFKISGMRHGYISRTYESESDYISSLFLAIPKLIVSILRELNSFD